ncbi:hypothetical protein PQ610_05190 [Tardisphaera miroshnichenkoae]
MQELLNAVDEAKSVKVISGRSLDAVMASAIIFDYLASSGLIVTMQVLDGMPDMDSDADLTVYVGTGYPSTTIKGKALFIDYALKGSLPDGYVRVYGSISRAIFQGIGYGISEAAEVGELDPFLRIPRVALPDELFAADAYTLSCPPLPGVINSKEQLIDKSSNRELLMKAIEELVHGMGFSLEFSSGVEREVFSEANLITRELFKKQGESAALALLIERGVQLKYEPDNLLLETLKQFFSRSDNWLTVNASVGNLLLLPSGLPLTYAISPAIPVISSFGGLKLPAFVIEPILDDKSVVWGIGRDFELDFMLSLIKKYNGVGLVSGRKFWAEFPHGAIEIANLLEEQRVVYLPIFRGRLQVFTCVRKIGCHGGSPFWNR